MRTLNNVIGELPPARQQMVEVRAQELIAEELKLSGISHTTTKAIQAMTPDPQQFASDNYAGICPEAWAAMAEANHGHAPAYGDDSWTQRASDAFRELFGKQDAEVFFAFNGTAANSLALASLCQSYHSVICASSAHVETDECGAPEFFSNGSKLLIAANEDGKLTPDLVRGLATSRSDIHFPKPRVVTITQPTETGQVYSLDEIRALSATCRELGLRLHMDGARFANALFLRASVDRLEALRQRGWQFYTFIGGGARFMFAWDADPARVDALARDIRV